MGWLTFKQAAQFHKATAIIRKIAAENKGADAYGGDIRSRSTRSIT